MKGVEEGDHLVGRERDGVEVQVVLKAQGGAARRRRNQVAGSVGQGDTEVLAQLEEHRILELGEVGGGHSDGVVNISDRGVLSAVAVGGTLAAGAGVNHTGGGGNVAPEQPGDGPQDPLSGESGPAVPERVGEVKEDPTVPSDGEKWSTGRVEQQEAIPPREIDLKHFEFNTREQAAVALDHGDDVIGGGEGELPKDTAVEVSGDPRVDPGGTLAAVDDRAALVGPGLRDSADGTAEHSEGKGGLVERAEESTKGEFLGDVGVHVVGGQAGIES